MIRTIVVQPDDPVYPGEGIACCSAGCQQPTRALVDVNHGGAQLALCIGHLYQLFTLLSGAIRTIAQDLAQEGGPDD